ncbi:MAG: glycosyltransferase family 4 protein [Planctomycetota bacterium]|nr:glycosyltransferase family 4 protein [Planctomycetota bacterium]
MSDATVNVLLIAGRYELRGAWTYTMGLAEQLGKHGFETTILCPEAQLLDSVERSRLHITECRHLRYPIWGKFVTRLLGRELASQPPRLIHIQSRRLLATGVQLARQWNRPCLLTIHDYLGSREKLVVDPTICRRMIAVSESVRKELLSHAYYPPEQIVEIPVGVDLPAASDVHPILDPSRVPVVGMVGPLEELKGIPYFLGAARKVLQMYGDVEFLIAGSGPEEENLRRLAQSLEIADHVTFAPNLSDVAPSLDAIDVFCLPSLMQGVGTIMLEAMALGKAVIAANVGGVHAAVKHQETGLLVSPGESGELATQIVELLRHPERARELGQRARQLVETRFATEHMVKQTASLYRTILEETERDAGSRQESKAVPSH